MNGIGCQYSHQTDKQIGEVKINIRLRADYGERFSQIIINGAQQNTGNQTVQ
jgi:hypothetical protein